MAKEERKLVDKYAQQNMKDIEKSIGGTVTEAQSQLPGAKEQAASSYQKAVGAATGLAEGGGPQNEYIAALAGGTANPYATSLATTGGVSDDEAQAMETSATRNVRSVYDVLGAEANRRAAITSGYGGTGGISRMARQAGQVASEAGTDARARIAQLRQGGRTAGAGLVTEQNIQGAKLRGDDLQRGSTERIAGAQLLTQQYGLSQEQSNAVMDMILKAQATGIQLTQQDIAFLAEMSKQKSGFGAVVEGFGQVAGGVGGLLTGVGGL